MSKAYHEWSPITDLPAEWRDWVPRFEPRAIGDVELAKRVWAIQTGLVEHLYWLGWADDGRGNDVRLAEEGFGLLADENPAKALIQDQYEVIDALYRYAAEGKRLSTSFIKELQAALTRHQPTAKGLTVRGVRQEVTLLRGAWKVLPNSPTRPDGRVHEYCPPEHVAAEMDRLLAWHDEHGAAGVHPIVEAAWLHHRFIQIHPFQDGNGRTARAVSSLVLLEGGWPPMTVMIFDRGTYLGALDAADKGDFGAMVDYFSHLFTGRTTKIQRRENWGIAMGLQKTDGGRGVSDFLRHLAEENIEGRMTMDEVQEAIRKHYAEEQDD